MCSRGLICPFYRMGCRGPSQWLNEPCALSAHFQPVSAVLALKPRAAHMTGQFKLHKETLSGVQKCRARTLADIISIGLLPVSQGQWHPSLCSQNLAGEPPQDRCAVPLAWTSFCRSYTSSLYWKHAGVCATATAKTAATVMDFPSCLISLQNS